MKTVRMTEALYSYVTEHTTLYDDVHRDLVDRTERLGNASIMQVGPDQGAFLTVLTQLMGAREAVEIGTFTGYSSLCIARGLAPGGRLLTCDVRPEWTDIARAAWERAGVADRIELRIGPAIETIRALPAEPVLDLAFIDADKSGYLGYYEELLPRIRPGGAIVADNVLWFGTVATPPFDEATTIIREFNDHVMSDKRVDAVTLTIGDGVLLIRKRP
jgi:caffeoyl-CoA O-methyltransferase